MAKRYEDRNRYGRGDWGRDRDRAHDRGYVERAADEVRSWFGDDDAERRRDVDEVRDSRQGQYRGRGQRDWSPSQWNRPSERGDWGRQAPWSRGASREWQGEDRDRDWQRDDRGRDWQWSDRGRDWGPAQGNWAGRDHWRDQRADWSGNRGDWAGEHRGSSHARSSSYSDIEEPRHGGTWSEDENRGTSAGYFGRGPKGYQRSDNRINEEVCDRLTYSDVDAENIEVTVSNGEVTLSGTVRDRWDKRRAEDLVEEIPGVRDVHNNIRVHREDRGIGMSNVSSSEQPGAVLGVNPTAGANIASPAPGTTPGTTTGTTPGATSSGTTGNTPGNKRS